MVPHFMLMKKNKYTQEKFLKTLSIAFFFSAKRYSTPPCKAKEDPSYQLMSPTNKI